MRIPLLTVISTAGCQCAWWDVSFWLKYSTLHSAAYAKCKYVKPDFTSRRCVCVCTYVDVVLQGALPHLWFLSTCPSSLLRVCLCVSTLRCQLHHPFFFSFFRLLSHFTHYSILTPFIKVSPFSPSSSPSFMSAQPFIRSHHWPN